MFPDLSNNRRSKIFLQINQLFQEIIYPWKLNENNTKVDKDDPFLLSKGIYSAKKLVQNKKAVFSLFYSFNKSKLKKWL